MRRFRRVIRKFKRRTWRAAKRRSPGGFNNLGAGYRPNFQGPRRRKRFGRTFYEKTPDHAIMVDGMDLDTYFKKKAKGKSKASSSSGYGFGRSSQPKGKGGNSLSGCFRCGKPGHMARDCPEQPSKGNGKGSNNAPTFAQTTSEQIGVPEFLLTQTGTTNIDSRPSQSTGYGFIGEPVDEALSFGVHAPMSDSTTLSTQQVVDAGPLSDLLGTVAPSAMEGAMNPVFMLTTESQEDKELQEVQDYMIKGDPWQGKQLGKKAHSTGNLQESILKNTDWSKWKSGVAEAPEKASMIARPLSLKTRDLEQRAREDPGAMFCDNECDAMAEPNHTSWWARNYCMQEPTRSPYDPAIGNRKPVHAADDILAQIQREQAEHGPVRKPSAFAEAFKERTPHGRPDPKMFKRSTLPFQVENHWPAKDAAYDQSGRTTSWFGAGTDAHAKGLSFSNEERITACDECQAPTTMAPCTICRMLFCDGCHRWGKHKFCHPPGGTASRPTPPGAPQPARSGHWMQPLPSEPDFCRGRPVQLRVDEHIREMQEIKTLSDNNRLLDADRRQKYWGIKKDQDRDRYSGLDRDSIHSQESGAKGKAKGRPSSLIDVDTYGPSRQRPETEKWAPFGTPSFSQSQAATTAEAKVNIEIPRPSADDLCTLPEAYRATQKDTSVPQCGVCTGTFTVEQYCLRLTCQHEYHAHCWHAYSEHHPSAARGPTAEAPRSCKKCGTEGKIDEIWQVKAPAQTQGNPQIFDISVGDVYHDSRSRSPSRPRENHESLGSMASWQLAVTEAVAQPVFQATPRSQKTPSVAGSNTDAQYPIFGETEEDVANWGYECSLNPSARPAEALAQAYGNADEPGLDSQVKTRLKGKTAVLVDVGAVGNLAGSEWARELATKALKTGRKPKEEPRTRGLKVAGVGTGSQTCHYDVHLPCAIPLADGGVLKCTFTTPTVPNSTLPALLGLQSLKNSRAIIDTNDSKVYFLGPGDYDLMKGLPPGTKQIQCEHAPSGHMMMPVDSYDELDKLERQGGLTIEETVLPVKAQES